MPEALREFEKIVRNRRRCRPALDGRKIQRRNTQMCAMKEEAQTKIDRLIETMERLIVTLDQIISRQAALASPGK
jgi:hypothetical protein